jgi:hypothetical protein
MPKQIEQLQCKEQAKEKSPCKRWRDVAEENLNIKGAKDQAGNGQITGKGGRL